ncbi:MAG: hypothetical protein AMJ75_01085 [Phycisphaerae bacterium SM1_79]|nr:MAG: hypothetical protein AMJ75_01085 [Phycisphaerae bacterium SM1_79]
MVIMVGIVAKGKERNQISKREGQKGEGRREKGKGKRQKAKLQIKSQKGGMWGKGGGKKKISLA